MKRPWNIINSPVYSLATYGRDGVNMNICTYVMPVSMQPKMYCIGIYYGTKTQDNLIRTKQAVLQLLHKDQISLVRTLGKKSGRDIDKKAYLEKKDLLHDWHGFNTLKNTCALLELEKTQTLSIEGDHEVAIFKVNKANTIEDQHILMFQDLIAERIIL